MDFACQLINTRINDGNDVGNLLLKTLRVISRFVQTTVYDPIYFGNKLKKNKCIYLYWVATDNSMLL